MQVLASVHAVNAKRDLSAPSYRSFPLQAQETCTAISKCSTFCPLTAGLPLASSFALSPAIVRHYFLPPLSGASPCKLAPDVSNDRAAIDFLPPLNGLLPARPAARHNGHLSHLSAPSIRGFPLPGKVGLTKRRATCTFRPLETGLLRQVISCLLVDVNKQNFLPLHAGVSSCKGLGFLMMPLPMHFPPPPFGASPG